MQGHKCHKSCNVVRLRSQTLQYFSSTGKYYNIYTNLQLQTHADIYIYTHTGCPRRNVQDFGRVFLMLNYTDITQNTYV